ncbi:hypothetical protein [uncultured Desulfosarcina sp.]|uniref:hypothetical protein n=1 Tax=uncultured Desulfosarcina sp. TaxID=218289 RepID=UPI0029C672AE|nr:hypothetical protein [uncultured Desulfosarcina sp.]
MRSKEIPWRGIADIRTNQVLSVADQLNFSGVPIDFSPDPQVKLQGKPVLFFQQDRKI